MDLISFVLFTTILGALASYLTYRYMQERMHHTDEIRSIWTEMASNSERISNRIDKVEEQFIREIGQVYQAIDQKPSKSSRT